jgi:type I thyroxine 5'-deiodinase
MHEDYGDRVAFKTIYIREAHPVDEWQMDSNVEENVCYRQPRSLEERVAIANDFVKRFDYPLPLIVDTMDDRTEKLYAGWPERFYIIDSRGIIVYKGKPGPFGFHPEEVEAWLAANAPRA